MSKYGPNWQRWKSNITVDSKCTTCNKTKIEKTSKYMHHLHHIDYNPANDDPSNFLVLCPSCHAKEHRLNDPKGRAAVQVFMHAGHTKSARTKARATLIKSGNSKKCTKAMQDAARQPEVNARRRASLLAQPIVSCPHCDKKGRGASMKRWHFERCKTLRKENI